MTRASQIRALLAANPEGITAGDLSRATGMTAAQASNSLAMMRRAGMLTKAPGYGGKYTQLRGPIPQADTNRARAKAKPEPKPKPAPVALDEGRKQRVIDCTSVKPAPVRKPEMTTDEWIARGGRVEVLALGQVTNPLRFVGDAATNRERQRNQRRASA